MKKSLIPSFLGILGILAVAVWTFWPSAPSKPVSPKSSQAVSDSAAVWPPRPFPAASAPLIQRERWVILYTFSDSSPAEATRVLHLWNSWGNPPLYWSTWGEGYYFSSISGQSIDVGFVQTPDPVPSWYGKPLAP